MSEIRKINLEELARFIVNAKKNTYAVADKMKIDSERPGFDELEYQEGDFYYRDSYVGFFQAPGMEVVRLNGEPIWSLAYSGGMMKEYHGDVGFAKEVFGFLKRMLGKVTEDIPYRGPREFEEGDWKYINSIEGNLERFLGHEKIFYKGNEVFSQDYIGGIILDK